MAFEASFTRGDSLSRRHALSGFICITTCEIAFVTSLASRSISTTPLKSLDNSWTSFKFSLKDVLQV